MKLIIDISEKDYEIFKELTPHYIDFMYHGVDERLILATRNGIPLDKIREEISEYKDDQLIHAERNEMIDIVLAIIDGYRKE